MHNHQSQKSMLFVLFVLVLFGVFPPAGYAYDQAVYEAQQTLEEKGYNPGPIDGLFGKRTAEAIRAFQESNSLPVTGKLDSKTRSALGNMGQPESTASSRSKSTGAGVKHSTGSSTISGGDFSFSGGRLRYNVRVQGDIIAFDKSTGGILKLTSGMTKEEIEAAAKTKKVGIFKHSEDEWRVGGQTIIFEHNKFTTMKNY